MRPSRDSLGKTTLSLLFLFSVAVLLYAGSRNSPFVFDDTNNIAENPHIRLTEISRQSLADVLKSRSINRPFANLTFAFNYYFHQYDTAGYRAVNLVIHVFTAFLVYLLARLTYALIRKETSFVPFLAALLWLAHPLHTQSVTYIVQRMNSLAAMFYLLTLVCYIKARLISSSEVSHPIRPVFPLMIGTISAGLSFASKEIAATLPVILFLYEWYFFQGLDRAWLKQKIKWIAVAAALLTAAALIYLGSEPLQRIMAGYEKQAFTPAQRLLTEPAVIIYYLSLLLWPHPARQILYYDFPLSTGLWSPPITSLALMALATLIVLAIYTARRDRLISFAVIWFLGTLVIESSFIGLALIFEHRTYLPSVFPLIALTGLYFRIRRFNKSALVIICVIISLAGLGTYTRNKIWQSDLLLWKDVVKKSPHQALPYNGLGLAHQNKGDYEAAVRYFKTAISKGLREGRVYNNLGLAYKDMGKYDTAIKYFKTAISKDPTCGQAYSALGYILSGKGQLEEATRMMRTALKHEPDNSQAHNNMGNIFLLKKKFNQAAEHYQKAIEINPEYGEAHINLGYVRLLQSETEPALNHFLRALALDSDNTLAHKYAGDIYLKHDKKDQALYHYKAALSRQPDNINILKQLAYLHVNQGDYARAASYLKRVVTIQPEDNKTHYNLACLYARQNKPEPAVEALKKAVQNGYNNFSHLKSDPDLENIRKTNYYQKITGENE
ncbi:MAG: tetratricopeptide repeat protein [Desulfosudaceae bacterium]